MKETKEYLQRLGLTESEAKVMVSLFHSPNSSAKHLSQDSGIANTKIYEILQSLEMKGLLKYTLDKPKRYTAVKPKTALDILISEHESNLKDIKKQHSEILKNIEIGYKIQEGEDLDPRIWLFRSNKAIFDEVQNILEKTERTMNNVGSRTSYRSFWERPETIDTLYKKMKQGMVMKSIYPDTFKATDFLLAIPTLFSKRGKKLLWMIKSDNFQQRIIPANELYYEYMVNDKKWVGIGYRGSEGNVQFGITFQDKSIANFMTDYFEHLWKKAIPMGKKFHKELEGHKK